MMRLYAYESVTRLSAGLGCRCGGERERAVGKHLISRNACKSLKADAQTAIGPGSTAVRAEDALTGAGGQGGDVRFKRTLSVIASLLIVSPSLAYAQDARSVGVAERPRPEYDPLGRQVGGFRLNASIDVGAEYSDNIFAEPSGSEDEDIYLVVRPDVRLSSNWSRHALYVGGRAAFREYNDITSESSVSRGLSAGGRLDIGRDTTLGLDASTAREIESRSDPSSVISLEPIEYDVDGLSVYATHAFSRLFLRVWASQSEYDFHNPAGSGFDQNLRDHTNSALGVRAQYALTPTLSLIGQIVSDSREYDIVGVSPDSDGVSYMVGAAFEVSRLLRGEVTVGQFERDYEPTPAYPSIGEVSGTALSGRLSWFVTPLTTVTVTGTRDMQDSGYESPYLNSAYSARVDHELLRNVILTAGVRTATLDFEEIDREDDALTYDVGARYLMNRRVSFDAAYVRTEVDSSGVSAHRSFEENRLRFGVRVAL